MLDYTAHMELRQAESVRTRRRRLCPGAGSIVGLNAFNDLNRISGAERGRTHRQASLGAVWRVSGG